MWETYYHLFESHFCLVRRPNEKGHVERLVDYARSNFLVPVPAVSSLAELNATLEEQCRRDQERHVRGKPGTIATGLAEDRAAFLLLPARPFEARRVEPTTADSLSLATFDTNEYSVPAKYAYRDLTVIATVDEVKIVHEDQVVARHRRPINLIPTALHYHPPWRCTFDPSPTCESHIHSVTLRKPDNKVPGWLSGEPGTGTSFIY